MQITGVARALQAEAAAWREDEAAAELMQSNPKLASKHSLRSLASAVSTS